MVLKENNSVVNRPKCLRIPRSQKVGGQLRRRVLAPGEPAADGTSTAVRGWQGLALGHQPLCGLRFCPEKGGPQSAKSLGGTVDKQGLAADRVEQVGMELCLEGSRGRVSSPGRGRGPPGCTSQVRCMGATHGSSLSCSAGKTPRRTIVTEGQLLKTCSRVLRKSREDIAYVK